MAKNAKWTIGRVDEIDLTEFDLQGLGAKTDTGAAICAIHCHSVKVVVKDDVEELWFKLLDKKHPQYQGTYYKTKDFRERKIRNSFGQEQTRFSITTKVKLFETEFTCEFTLADREKMNYPCLLGRNLLRQGFLVDVLKKNQSVKYSNAAKK